MKRGFAALSALASALVLQGCATPHAYKYAIPAEARSMLASVEVVTPVAADKIMILPPQYQEAPYNSSYEQTYGVGPSLAANLIVNLAIAGANQRLAMWAEDDIKPLRAALGDFHFAPVIEADLNAKVKEVVWLNGAPVRITSEDMEGTADKLVAASKANAILWTPVRYSLTDKADRLQITMRAFVFPASTDLKQLLTGTGSAKGMRPDQDNILYRNLLTYTTAIPGATTDRVTNVAIWAKDDAAALRDAMKQGSAKLAEMLIEDLKTLPDPLLEPDAYQPVQVLKTDETGTYTRGGGGVLAYSTRLTEQALVVVRETERPGTKVSKTKPPSGNFY